MKHKVDYTLYLVTDRDLMTTDTVEECVEQAIAGGVTVVQLREKKATSCDALDETALRIREITARFGVKLIINDRLDLALAVDADGIHIGQNDMPYHLVRTALGEDKIIGVSANNVEEAVEAENMGADYLGVGAMFATGTKGDARPTSFDELKRIREAVNIPIVAIGGINESNLHCFEGTSIDGIAVVSAIVSQKDIKSATENLKTAFQNIIASEFSSEKER